MMNVDVSIRRQPYMPQENSIHIARVSQQVSVHVIHPSPLASLARGILHLFPVSTKVTPLQNATTSARFDQKHLREWAVGDSSFSIPSPDPTLKQRHTSN